ncbi:MAG: hypothetical protein L3J29_03075 [Cyclobacteriaceae bacterium]|nr:hypothetical protein [Cyclobacteriaceae bacterium]
MMNKNVFSKAAITGIAVIIISLWMMIVGKVNTEGIWMPEGLKVPILALEFALSSKEMSRIVVSISPESNARIVAGTQIDMLFLIAYNLFLFFVLRSIYKITNLLQYKWLALLPFVVMVADAAENYQLFMALASFKYSITLLKVATWVKWLGLAASFTAIGRFLITTGRYYDKVLALSTYITLPLGIWAMFAHNGINEVFAMLFYLLFPLMVIYTWFSGVKLKES